MKPVSLVLQRVPRSPLRSTGLLAGLMAMSLIALSGCGGGDSGSADDAAGGSTERSSVVFGTSSVGSAYYTTAVAMSKILSDNTAVDVSVQSVGGSDATVRAMGEGHADLGMTSSEALTEGFKGEGSFEDALDVRVMAAGFGSNTQLIVRKDSGVETPADLEGKRIVGERPALSSVEKFTTAMLNAYGVDPDSVKIIATSDTDEALDALKQGTVAGVVLPGSTGAPNFKELAQNTDVRWVDMSEEIDAMLEEMGAAFSAATIPAGTYGDRQPDDVVTVSAATYLAVKADLSEESVYEMTKALFENNDSLASDVPNGKFWNVENTLDRELTVPFHPGAVRYFEETGSWSKELQEQQDSLL
ncbi:MAG: TAXI family TRAP transporter solute-binding subunit [Mycobacteriales bacterium]